METKTYIVSGDFTVTGNIYVEATSAQEAVDMVREGSCWEVEDISEFEVNIINNVDSDSEDAEDDWV